MHKCFATDTCFCKENKNRKEKNQHHLDKTRKKAINSYKNKSLQIGLNK